MATLKAAKPPPPSIMAAGPARAASSAPVEKPATMAFFMSFLPRSFSSVHSRAEKVAPTIIKVLPWDTERALIWRGGVKGWGCSGGVCEKAGRGISR